MAFGLRRQPSSWANRSDHLVVGQFEMLGDGLAIAGAAVSKDGEDKGADEAAQGDAGVGMVMQGVAGAAGEELHADAEAEFFGQTSKTGR